jgi:hypothetical protein
MLLEGAEHSIPVIKTSLLTATTRKQNKQKNTWTWWRMPVIPAK